ncbi:MAG: thioredoxin domain-containing protein [Chloroflexi bacterium]|nr:thioredoxin domain-containing protein [Chloroflexota bacterium]
MVGSRRRRRRRRGGAGSGQQSEQQAEQQAQQEGRGLKATIDSFGGFLTIGIVVATVAIVVALIWFNRPGGSNSAGDLEFEYRGSSAPVDGKLFGSPDAPIRIVAFEDFTCGHCGDFNRDTKPLLEEEYINQGLVSIEYRHLPLLGPDSVNAAAASECAVDQNLFWPYHDVLFQRQGRAGWASEGNLKNFAREVAEQLPEGAFDLDRFDSCVESGIKELVVEEEARQSAQVLQGLLGRLSTPNFLINGQVVPGAQPIERFREVIDSLVPDDGG